MNESVTISLDRYNEYLFYKEKYNLLIETQKSLADVLEAKNFDIENPLHYKIYKIYEKLC